MLYHFVWESILVKKYTEGQLVAMHAAVIDELNSGNPLLLKMTSNTSNSLPMMVHGHCRKAFDSTYKVAVITVRPATGAKRPDGSPFLTVCADGIVLEEYSCNFQYSRNVGVHIPRYWWDPATNKFISADDWWPQFMASKGIVDFLLK